MRELRGSKILVTGGAGFIGSHLCRELVSQGAKVTVVDDFSNGTLDNLRGVECDVVHHDISEPSSTLPLSEHMRQFGGIFHLACYPRSISFGNPERCMRVNAGGTLNVIRLARESGAKIVFTSNSGIYGDPEYLPIDEKHSDKPSTPYDAHKLVSEYYLKMYNKVCGIPNAICRLATVYGERQRTKPDWKPVISEFVDKLLKDQAPTIYWDGEQTRDLIYVKDVVQGLIKAYLCDNTDNEVFLLATGRETSVNEIYRIVSRVLDVDVTPVREAKVDGDIRRMMSSYAKAEKVFGFVPEYTVGQGVERYISWVMEQE